MEKIKEVCRGFPRLLSRTELTISRDRIEPFSSFFLNFAISATTIKVSKLTCWLLVLRNLIFLVPITTLYLLRKGTDNQTILYLKFSLSSSYIKYYRVFFCLHWILSQRISNGEMLLRKKMFSTGQSTTQMIGNKKTRAKIVAKF